MPHYTKKLSCRSHTTSCLRCCMQRSMPPHLSRSFHISNNTALQYNIFSHHTYDTGAPYQSAAPCHKWHSGADKKYLPFFSKALSEYILLHHFLQSAAETGVPFLLKHIADHLFNHRTASNQRHTPFRSCYRCIQKISVQKHTRTA